jgi:hypothetical protein
MFTISTGRTSTEPPTSKIGAALRDFHGVREIVGLDQHVAADNILGFGVGTVVDALLFAPDDLSGLLQRMSGVFDAGFGVQFLKPGDPLLHIFLHLLGRRGCISAAKQKCKFTHCLSFLGLESTPLDVWRHSIRQFFAGRLTVRVRRARGHASSCSIGLAPASNSGGLSGTVATSG